MVTPEEIRKESEQMIKDLGPKFFKELGQAIHQGQLESKAKRCKSLGQYNRDSMRRMLIWEGYCCGPRRD